MIFRLREFLREQRGMAGKPGILVIMQATEQENRANGLFIYRPWGIITNYKPRSCTIRGLYQIGDGYITLTGLVSH